MKAENYLDPSYVFQSGDLTELVVERVDHEPSVHVRYDEENPEEAHEDVIPEEHVIHDR